jgi:exoribonuclease-2
VEDNLYFKRKGSLFVPKSTDQVASERTRRQRQREHEEFRERAAALITELVRKKTIDITTETQPLLERLQRWLKQKTGDEVGSILEDIVGASKARDVAYDILLRGGMIDPDADRFLVLAGVDAAFSPQLVEAAEALAPHSHSSARIDYQDAPAITIDDEDTREVDDALTVTRSGNEIVVGVHIADVSAFVAKGDLLDAEAARRSSTIYLPTGTVVMFPERLSTDLASLRADVSRPAFTIEVRFDTQGNRLGYRIVLSTIRVQRRLSYDEADLAMESGEETLRTLHDLALQLQRVRAGRGAITFRRPELKVRVHDDEILIKKINPNSPSRVLVSEMMILANGLAADFAAVNSLPVIFRIQEPREALAVEETPIVEAVAFERLRKTFKRSRLSLTPGLHSGLGLTAYTQASSPIRRYADLVTQRQFTATLAGASAPYNREELLRVLATAEAAETEVRALEERSTNFWILEYLAREKKDQSLAAVILDIKGSIELEDYYLRGKVASLAKHKPGETVQVRIESVDPVRGDVRFKIA